MFPCPVSIDPRTSIWAGTDHPFSPFDARGYLLTPTRSPAEHGLYLLPVSYAVASWSRNFHIHGFRHALPMRYIRTTEAGARKSIFGCDGGQARLRSLLREQIPRGGSDKLSLQELVEPDGFQRTQNAGTPPDAGIHQHGERHGPAPVQMGGGRRRNPEGI